MCHVVIVSHPTPLTCWAPWQQSWLNPPLQLWRRRNLPARCSPPADHKDTRNECCFNACLHHRAKIPAPQMTLQMDAEVSCGLVVALKPTSAFILLLDWLKKGWSESYSFHNYFGAFLEQNQACWYLTFPTMLPTVMMDPLGAPQATRAWATACVTKKEPWKKHKGKGKKMRTGWTHEKTASYISTFLQITYTALWSLEPFTLVYTMSGLCTQGFCLLRSFFS